MEHKVCGRILSGHTAQRIPEGVAKGNLEVTIVACGMQTGSWVMQNNTYYHSGVHEDLITLLTL